MPEYIIITFQSTNFAMQAEALFKSQGVKHQIIPTPREITLSCGISIRLDTGMLNKVKSAVQAGGITPKKIFSMKGSAGRRKLEEINLI
jgi:hypothetical protein